MKAKLQGLKMLETDVEVLKINSGSYLRMRSSGVSPWITLAKKWSYENHRIPHYSRVEVPAYGPVQRQQWQQRRVPFYPQPQQYQQTGFSPMTPQQFSEARAILPPPAKAGTGPGDRPMVNTNQGERNQAWQPRGQLSPQKNHQRQGFNRYQSGNQWQV